MGKSMSALQHIVAERASPFLQHPVALPEIPLRHYGYMADNDSNGGPNHLEAWRKYRGLSQAELAEKAGTSHQVIGYLERGRTQLSAKWLRKLAPILETTPGMLLDHDPTELDSDVVDMWTHATARERRQIADIARTITRTGTDD
jgi:transcriptional regulator with XRE-family HTH domain